MFCRQKPELYGPWQLLPPVKQLTPLWVQVPHQGDVSATPYAAEAQSSQSDWQVWSVGLNVGLAVGLMVGRGVAAAGLAWAGLVARERRADALRFAAVERRPGDAQVLYIASDAQIRAAPKSASNCLRKAPVIPVREMRRKQPSGLRYDAFCTPQKDATAIGPTRETRRPWRELK